MAYKEPTYHLAIPADIAKDVRRIALQENRRPPGQCLLWIKEGIERHDKKQKEQSKRK